MSFCVADNQREQIAGAAQKSILYAPSFDRDYKDVVSIHTLALLENESLREKISYRAMQEVAQAGGCSGST